jgi:hypothetical protein
VTQKTAAKGAQQQPSRVLTFELQCENNNMKLSVLEFLLTSNSNGFRDVRKCMRVPVAL